MNIYKLIGVIAIAAILGTACKKDESKKAESIPEVKKVDGLLHPCGTYWYDNKGYGHISPCYK